MSRCLPKHWHTIISAMMLYRRLRASLRPHFPLPYQVAISTSQMSDIFNSHTCSLAICCKCLALSSCTCFSAAYGCAHAIRLDPLPLPSVPFISWQPAQLPTTSPSYYSHCPLLVMSTHSCPVSQSASTPAPQPLAANTLHFHPASASALPVGGRCKCSPGMQPYVSSKDQHAVHLRHNIHLMTCPLLPY